MIKRLFKKLLAPIVREVVREENEKTIEKARQLVLKELELALSHSRDILS